MHGVETHAQEEDPALKEIRMKNGFMGACSSETPVAVRCPDPQEIARAWNMRTATGSS